MEMFLGHPQVVPDGVLFFFPSYSAMDMILSRWQVHHYIATRIMHLSLDQ